MKKLAIYISTIVITVAMFLPCAASVDAANPSTDSDKVAPGKPYLTVLAVDSTEVGQVVKITISSNTNRVVDKAAVYVIDSDNLTLPVDVKATASNINYAEVAAKIGLLIGYTDIQGNIQYTFKENGWFILVAIKDGYASGTRKIAVGQVTQIKQLVIKMPDSADAGDLVKFSVFNRSDQSGVAGSGIYALKISAVAPFPLPPTLSNAPSVSNHRPEAPQTTNAAKGSSEPPKSGVAQQQPGIDEIKAKGILLGMTDNNSELQYTFTDSGLYIIAAIKDGYLPAISRLDLRQSDRKNGLQIKSPNSVLVSENITIGVYERKGNKPVEKVAVYFLKYKPVIGPAPVLTDNGTATRINIEPGAFGAADASQVVKAGTLIGFTDAGGQLKYSFAESGNYILAAIKDGYDPDTARIEVRLTAAQDFLRIIAQATARVNQSVTFRVSARSNKGEAGVSIYIIKDSDLPVSDNTSGARATMIKPQLYADYAQTKGTLIGTTDENGKLAYTFTVSGRFVVVAIKDGFIPGFARVNVTAILSNALSFKLPSNALQNQDVTIQVKEKSAGSPIADADVYAYHINGFGDAIGHFFQETFSFGNSAREKYAGGVSEIGEYIGATDNTGSLIYAFADKGTYVLVTFKSGYVPDFGKIEVSTPSTQSHK